MRAALAVLCAAVLAGPAAGQTTIRRIQPKAFPFAVTPSAGFGFGATRATYYEPVVCSSPEACYQYGTGSGWQAGLDLQVPLGQVLGFEVAGQVGRPSLRQCLRGQCTTVQRTWSIRGTGTLVWRFKARAPLYFGLGAAVAYFNPGPVLLYQDEIDVTEFGATAVVGFDFPINQRLGGRIIWRSYFMIPSGEGLPDPSVLSSMAWDQALTFGVRILLAD
jgi:hypothetical protein